MLKLVLVHMIYTYNQGIVVYKMESRSSCLCSGMWFYWNITPLHSKANPKYP
jgi:hypothetical protein